MPVIWSCTKWDDVIIEFLEQKSWHFPLSHMWAPAGWTHFSGALRQTGSCDTQGWGWCFAWIFGVIWFFRGSSVPCTITCLQPSLSLPGFFSSFCPAFVFLHFNGLLSFSIIGGWQVFSPSYPLYFDLHGFCIVADCKGQSQPGKTLELSCREIWML